MQPAPLPPDSTPIGHVPPGEPIRATVVLNTDDPAVVDKVRLHFRTQYGLFAAARRGRYLDIDSTAGRLSDVFGVELDRHMRRDRTIFRHHAEPARLDPDIAPHVIHVFGLDTSFRAKPHLRVARPEAASSGYTAAEVAKLYNFPAGDGSGQCVALIELGGGYVEADLATYASTLGLPAPKVTAVPVDGVTNVPGQDPLGADGEVMLDVEVVMAVAPAASIAVYFAPNTDQGFLDAIEAAANDAINKPSVISISWGAPEAAWSTTVMQAYDAAFASIAARGITVLAASGDGGFDDGVGDGNPHVDFPASDPHVVGCGGTAITVANGAIASEVVWDDLAQGGGATGGGISAIFAEPAWQVADRIDKGLRCVPDVAGNAAPGSGYRVIVDGQWQVIGGTSAVAPLYAGLFAVVNQVLGRDVGAANPALYAINPAAWRDITAGSNGHWVANPDYDLCTGLGRIDGAAMLDNILWAIEHAVS